MPKLKRKTRLVRGIARQVAEELAEQGDRSILDAAEELAHHVRWVSIDGALEIIFCTAIHQIAENGHAAEIAEIKQALDRYDEGEKSNG